MRESFWLGAARQPLSAALLIQFFCRVHKSSRITHQYIATIACFCSYFFFFFPIPLLFPTIPPPSSSSSFFPLFPFQSMPTSSWTRQTSLYRIANETNCDRLDRSVKNNARRPRRMTANPPPTRLNSIETLQVIKPFQNWNIISISYIFTNSG